MCECEESKFMDYNKIKTYTEMNKKIGGNYYKKYPYRNRSVRVFASGFNRRSGYTKYYSVEHPATLVLKDECWNYITVF